MKHPLHSPEISVFLRIEGRTLPPYRAVIERPRNLPIFFTGITADEARSKAAAWCKEQADQHQAQFAEKAAKAARRGEKMA